MSDTFPRGPGVAQGGGAGQVTMKTPFHAVVDNEPEADGPSDFPRPWPTDEGGTNTAGWMKTPDYDDGYYGIDSGLWRQV
jgi:hypothetical protein